MPWPVNEVVEVKFGYIVNGQQCYNVIHLLAEEQGTQSPLDYSEDLVAYFASTADTAGSLVHSMRLLMSEDAALNTISAQGIYPTRYRAFIGDLVDTNGLVASPCNAQNLAAVIEKFGEGGSRHDVGSFHLGGLPADAYVDGELAAGTFTALGVLATKLKGTFGDGVLPDDLSYTHHILNKTKETDEGKDKYVISGSTEIVGTKALTGLRTMRRRTVRRGI